MVRATRRRGGKAFGFGRVTFGCSDGRGALRDFFEVDARYVALATLTELAKLGKLEWSVVQGAMKDFGIKDDKKNPLLV